MDLNLGISSTGEMRLAVLFNLGFPSYAFWGKNHNDRVIR